jgi:hypothetical protein
LISVILPEADIQRTCELRGITDKKFKGRKADIGTYGEIKLSRDLKLFIGDADQFMQVSLGIDLCI